PSVHPDPHSFPTRRSSDLGSVPGVAADATPNEVSQAIVRAPDEQISALGRRMLRGVVGRAFSHAAGRPALTGVVAGAISSVVALDRKSTRLNSSHVSISYA